MIDRAAFLARRREGIGGSDVAAILGLNPWRTPSQVYAEKRGESEEESSTLDMLIGAMLEPWIAEEYQRITGMNVRRSHQLWRDSEHAFLVGNIDGTIPGGIVEFKTARNDDEWGDPGTDQIPTPYLLQVQHYLRVSGRNHADLAVLFKHRRKPELSIYHIPADRELQVDVVDRLVGFWQGVQDGVPPEPISVEEAQQRWRRSVDRVVEATPELAADAAAMRRVRAEITALEEQLDAAKLRLMQAMGDADALHWQGKPLVTWRQAKGSARVDAKLLRERYPQIAAEVTVESEGSRRFLLKGGDE